MTIAEEFRSRNFSIYGQWTGVLCIILCLAIGISQIFTGLFNVNVGRIIFAVLCIVSALLIIFVEIPLLMRICPTSEKFDVFMRRFTTNYMRAAFYVVLCAVEWLSLVSGTSSLIACAVFLTFAAVFYAIAGVRGHDFANSKTLGGQGIAQMIV